MSLMVTFKVHWDVRGNCIEAGEVHLQEMPMNIIYLRDLQLFILIIYLNPYE